MASLTEQRASKAGVAALAPYKAAGVSSLTDDSLMNAARIAWGGPNWGGDPAFLAACRAEMQNRGILAAYDASNVSPNYTVGAIVKAAVVFYGTAYAAASGLQALTTASSPASAAAATTAPAAAPVAAAPVAAVAAPAATTTISGIAATTAATLGSVAGIAQTLAPKKTPPISAPQAAADPAPPVPETAKSGNSTLALIGVAAVIALPFV